MPSMYFKIALVAMAIGSISGCASVPANSDLHFCPTADTLRQDGIPPGFVFYDTGALTEGDYTRVTDLDTVRLDQNSAEIIDDQYATADYVRCLYGTNVIMGDSSPFYIIRTRPLSDKARILVDFRHRVDPNHSGWGGFCWGPEDQQNGCIVVCHFHPEKCPFSFSTP